MNVILYATKHIPAYHGIIWDYRISNELDSDSSSNDESNLSEELSINSSPSSPNEPTVQQCEAERRAGERSTHTTAIDDKIHHPAVRRILRGRLCGDYRHVNNLALSKPAIHLPFHDIREAFFYYPYVYATQMVKQASEHQDQSIEKGNPGNPMGDWPVNNTKSVQQPQALDGTYFYELASNSLNNRRNLQQPKIATGNDGSRLTASRNSAANWIPTGQNTATQYQTQHPDLQKYLINLKNAVILDNTIHKPHHTITKQTILKQTIQHALNELHKRPEIHIANTDKNLGPIIMDLTHYHSLVLQELNQTCYTTIPPDKIPPNSQFKDELTDIIHKHNIKPNSGISKYILQDIPTDKPPCGAPPCGAHWQHHKYPTSRF
jgi:hypothetical protein